MSRIKKSNSLTVDKQNIKCYILVRAQLEPKLSCSLSNSLIVSLPFCFRWR